MGRDLERAFDRQGVIHALAAEYLLTTTQATLLLPLEQAANNEKITAEFVKDHVILCDGPSRKNAHIITLSGLRGTLDG